MKNVQRKSDCEYADTCVYKCKDKCKYYRKKKKFPPCPYVKEEDGFSAEQIKQVRTLVAKFGSITSLMVLAAVALVVFTVLSSGLGLFLADKQMTVLLISAAIGIIIVILCGLAIYYYIKIQYTVRRFRAEKAGGKRRKPHGADDSGEHTETEEE